jgi:uncharacterized protein (TIGR02996 family)
MTNEEALLRAIRSDPNDELARLALADYLDDNGDPQRAEFVRLQLQLFNGIEDPVARSQVRQRETKLLVDNVKNWLGPFASALPQVWRYERGTAVVTLPADLQVKLSTMSGKWHAHAAEWFPRGWVLDLHLSGKGDLGLLLEQPWLDRISRLRFEKVALDDGALDALAACESLGGLYSLGLVSCGMTGRVERLIDSPHLGSLKALDLSDNKLKTADVESVRKAFPELHRLNLSRNEMKRPAIDALLNNWPEGLVSLQLAGCGLDPDLIKRLCASPRLAGLQELNLSGNYMRESGAGHLARCEHLTNLRRLGLRNSGISGSGAASLASSGPLKTLQMLDVFDSGAGRSGLDRLKDSFGPALRNRLDEAACWAS